MMKNTPVLIPKKIKWTDIIDKIISAKNIYVATNILSQYLFTPVSVLNKIANDTLQIDFCDIHNAFNNIFIKINEKFYKYYENIILDIIIKACPDDCDVEEINREDSDKDILIKCFIATLEKYTFFFMSYKSIINREKFVSLRERIVMHFIHKYGLIYKLCTETSYVRDEYFIVCDYIPGPENNPYLYYINHLTMLNVFDAKRNTILDEYKVSMNIMSQIKLYYNMSEEQIKKDFFDKINFEANKDYITFDNITVSKFFLLKNKMFYIMADNGYYYNICNHKYDKCSNYKDNYINYNIIDKNTDIVKDLGIPDTRLYWNYEKDNLDIVYSNLSSLERCKYKILEKNFNYKKLECKTFTLRNPLTNDIFLNTYDNLQTNLIDISLSYNKHFISRGRIYGDRAHICDLQCEIQLFSGIVKVYLTDNIKDKFESIQNNNDTNFIDIIIIEKYIATDAIESICNFCNKELFYV